MGTNKGSFLAVGRTLRWPNQPEMAGLLDSQILTKGAQQHKPDDN